MHAKALLKDLEVLPQQNPLQIAKATDQAQHTGVERFKRHGKN
jgi:hypothetical protein